LKNLKKEQFSLDKEKNAASAMMIRAIPPI